MFVFFVTLQGGEKESGQLTQMVHFSYHFAKLYLLPVYGL